MVKKVAIIGSHGLYASYGGWDQLVKNLVEFKDKNIHYLIFNSRETPCKLKLPEVKVVNLPLSASGVEGLIYDAVSILYSWFCTDTLLLLGSQGMPVVRLLNKIKKKNIVVNVGGVEWERPKFGKLAKLFLRATFDQSFVHADHVIIDNKYYGHFIKNPPNSLVHTIPYGGIISSKLFINELLLTKYPFLKKPYFLSISRALEDNKLYELCESFVGSTIFLVLISNFDSSEYGKKILNQYGDCENIRLINGLYNKDELDLIRLNCKAYIHTHTLCGTAPSLVEMIVARRPILSIDVEQNRNTLTNQGYYFSSFVSLVSFIERSSNLDQFIPNVDLVNIYSWPRIIKIYEELY